ncbi:anti-sigma K factor RskA [Acidocella aquatica]|uniref:Anti-sigma K factor RskA n=1 Tax=Acidocella aquatica TaxID=1922313 RepID=A0ABQ6A564_9PROT|nr:anti-sigma factor [Acidocella aquatica]GLR65343.1 anti-sigma K factor RskA [Acidocella aquatica]
MTEDDFNALAGEYVLGLLEGAALNEAEALMRADAGFAALVQSWENRLMPLIETTPDFVPPPLLWDRIAVATRPATARAPGVVQRLFAGLAQRFRIGGATVGVALALLALFFFLHTPPEAGRQIAALRNRDGGTFIVEQTKTAMIIVPRNITLPAGRVAELWLLAPHHAPQAIGVFQSGQSLNMALPKTSASGLSLAVSLEPPGGAPGPTPTGPIIAEGAITLL